MAVTLGLLLLLLHLVQVWQGAATLGWRLEKYLAALKEAGGSRTTQIGFCLLCSPLPLLAESHFASFCYKGPPFCCAGLGSLPGTAAEVLDDAVRATLCPDKLSSAQWAEVVAAAHKGGQRIAKHRGTCPDGSVSSPEFPRSFAPSAPTWSATDRRGTRPCSPPPSSLVVGLRTTSTIMFGHCEEDAPAAWARHLLTLRRLQQRAEAGAAAAGDASSSGSGVGISEFVPLPFVHMEAPIYLKGAPLGY